MATVLAVDTCGAEGYVAVFSLLRAEQQPLSERRLTVRATQEELLPAIGLVLSEAGVGLQELSAIAVVRGPGSFTGVRIGLAAAKGLCEAAGLPLVTMSRLQVLASVLPSALQGPPVWAWLQAGRGDVYAARFAGTGSTRAISAPFAPEPLAEHESAQVLTLAQATAVAGREPVAVCEEELRAATPGVVFVSTAELDVALRAAAAVAVRSESWSDVALIDALYLRVPDAELALRARQGLTQG